MKKIAILILLAALIFPVTVFAQGASFDPGGTIADALKLPTRDARSTFITILQYFLTTLGLVAVVTIMYAGFRYLTSGGNQDIIKHSRDTLKTATIGLALVLLAQAILVGLITIFTNVTTSP